MTPPTTRKVLVALAAAMLAVALAPGPSLATHQYVKAKRVGPGDFKWRDSETNTATTHLLSTPHRFKFKNPRNGVRHDVVFYRQPSGASVSDIDNLRPGETKRRRIPRGGWYKYRCTIHSGFNQNGACQGMCGRIRAH
ncbi:MAG: cupredoxin domain-containing protein [Actinomycetota bacterium]